MITKLFKEIGTEKKFVFLSSKSMRQYFKYCVLFKRNLKKKSISVYFLYWGHICPLLRNFVEERMVECKVVGLPWLFVVIAARLLPAR